MKKQLHIIKNSSDENAQSIIQILSENYPEQIKVVLIQDGIGIKPTWKGETYLLNDSNPLPSSLPKGITLIDFGKFVDLIFEADSVVGW